MIVGYTKKQFLGKYLLNSIKPTVSYLLCKFLLDMIHYACKELFVHLSIIIILHYIIYYIFL